MNNKEKRFFKSFLKNYLLWFFAIGIVLFFFELFIDVIFRFYDIPNIIIFIAIILWMFLVYFAFKCIIKKTLPQGIKKEELKRYQLLVSKAVRYVFYAYILLIVFYVTSGFIRATYVRHESELVDYRNTLILVSLFRFITMLGEIYFYKKLLNNIVYNKKDIKAIIILALFVIIRTIILSVISYMLLGRVEFYYRLFIGN